MWNHHHDINFKPDKKLSHPQPTDALLLSSRKSVANLLECEHDHTFSLHNDNR